MEIVHKKFPNIKGIIVGKTAFGDEKYEEEIRRFLEVRGLGSKIVLLGYRRDVPALLNAMDIVVHASIEPEPFGRVVLEAMAMRKPIIATDSGGIRELITSGECGILVPMGDERAMAHAIEESIADRAKAEKFGINARKRSEENFSVSNMVRGVEAIYESILNE
jgi:glycosyltransferase involved in cell wall biosynthesis